MNIRLYLTDEILYRTDEQNDLLNSAFKGYSLIQTKEGGRLENPTDRFYQPGNIVLPVVKTSNPEYIQSMCQHRQNFQIIKKSLSLPEETVREIHILCSNKLKALKEIRGRYEPQIRVLEDQIKALEDKRAEEIRKIGPVPSLNDLLIEKFFR